MYKTLKEMYGSEVKFTQHLSNDYNSLNKINALRGLPTITNAVNEYSIPDGRIDIVGFTDKGHAVIYEHQDQRGRADQDHVGKTSHYARVLKSQGITVLGAFLLCESIDQIFLDTFKDIRWAYERRNYNGHCNVHAVKSQWTDQGEYVPALFEESDIIQKEDKVIVYYRDFIDIYAKDWLIQRETISEGAKTLWFRNSNSKGDYYIHKLKSCYKIGIHFNSPTDQDKKLVDRLGGRHNQTKSTYEIELPLTSTDYDIWLTAEKLKQQINKIQLDKNSV